VESDYVPASSLSWVDLDDTAARKVNEAIRALDEPGTLDPIGLGSVRDAIADAIAPGTSTIQTRLRYFLFVPWIFQKLDREQVAPAEFAGRLRSTEAQLIACLRHLGANVGVIGRTRGEALKRMPSAAYWGGLRSWGIRRADVSIADYPRAMVKLRRMTNPGDGDDADAGGVGPRTVWASMPAPPAAFLEAEADFGLSIEEAAFITDCIRMNRRDSLLAAACADPDLAAAANWSWEVDDRLLNDRLRTIVEHAHNISDLTLGATHLYNLLVARRAHSELGMDVEGLVAGLEEAMARWVTELNDRATRILPWVEDLDGFWNDPIIAGRVPESARRFITKVIVAAADDPGGFEVAMRDEIVSREFRLKGGRARLHGRSALMAWDGQTFGGRLEFRWSVARSYLADIGEAIGRTT